MSDHEAVTNKLSPEAKLLLAECAAEGRGDTDVFVRTVAPVTADDQASLAQLGVTVRSVAGDILTARLPVDRLADLAGLPIVAYVEVSRPLQPEG